MGLSPDATTWIACHHGVVSGHQLKRFGLNAHQIGRLVKGGVLLRAHHGVYRSSHWPMTEESRCVAACLAYPSGAISHETAGRLWGLRRCKSGNGIELIAPIRRSRAHDVAVHQVGELARTDIVRRDDGIALTNPVRTACDLAARLDPEDLASVIEQILNDFRIRFTTVLRTAERLARPGWAGAAQLRAVLAGRAPNSRPHDSHLEVRFARALTRAGLPNPVAQLPVAVANGIVIHGDLGYPAARLLVEIDHRTWHSGEQAAIDKRRDRLTKLVGFDTVRVTDDDLEHHFDRTVREIEAIYARAVAAA